MLQKNKYMAVGDGGGGVVCMVYSRRVRLGTEPSLLVTG